MRNRAIFAGLALLVAVGVIVLLTQQDAEPKREAPQRSSEDLIVEGGSQMPAGTLAPSPIDARPYTPTAEDEAPEPRATGTPKGPPATVTGRVVDERGAAQRDVTVMISSGPIGSGFLRSEPDVRTGPDGRFECRLAQAHVDVEIRARAPHLCDTTLTTVIRAPGAHDVGDLVARDGGSVAGIVSDLSGVAIAGARVSAWPVAEGDASGPVFVAIRGATPPHARGATTDASGHYRIDGLPEGAHYLEAATAKHEPASTRARIVKREVAQADFQLSSGVTVSGIVRGETGQPIEGALVTVRVRGGRVLIPTEGRALADRSAVTAADGRFTISGLPAGRLSLRARKDGYLRATQDVTPGADTIFVLRPCGVIFGHVRNSATNEPVNTFQIDPTVGRVLRGAEAAAAARVQEDPGLFALVEIPEARVSMTVRAPGFATCAIDATAASGTIIETPVKLDAEATISGVVVDPHGAPVAGADVGARLAKQGRDDDSRMFRVRRVRSEGDDEGAGVRSAADGSFTIGGLAPGSYAVSASHQRMLDGEPVTVAVASGQAVRDIRVVLAEGGTLAGRALGRDGRPRPGLSVSVRPRARSEGEIVFDEDSAISDPAGTFEITGLRPGPYVATVREDALANGLRIFLPDRTEEGTPVTIEAGKVTRVDLTLPPTSTLSGVVREGGKPAEGVRVALSQRGKPAFFANASSVKTDANGSFVARNVAPGEYDLVVTPPEAGNPIREPVTIAPHADQHVVIDLPTGAIEGRVTESGTGRPLAGIRVEAVPERDGSSEEQPVMRAVVVSSSGDEDEADIAVVTSESTIRTDLEGRFRMRYVSEGVYRISVEGGGILPADRTGVAVKEGRTTKGIDFEAEKGATLHVTIDPAGTTATHAFGFLEPEGGGPAAKQDSASGTVKGGLKFTGLKPGRYTLRVSAVNLENETVVPVDIAPGVENRTTVRLSS